MNFGCLGRKRSSRGRVEKRKETNSAGNDQGHASNAPIGPRSNQGRGQKTPDTGQRAAPAGQRAEGRGLHEGRGISETWITHCAGSAVADIYLYTHVTM